jgi:hypothetical protein
MTREEKEGTGWILENGEPRQIECVSGFALEDGFPYVVEKHSRKNVMGRLHHTKDDLIAAVIKDYKKRIAEKQSDVKALRAELKHFRRRVEDSAP